MMPPVRSIRHALRPICHRAFSIAACAMLLSAGCSREHAGLEAPGPAGSTQLMLLVSNEVSNDVSVVDLAQGNLLRSIPVGKRPRGLRVSADGSRLFVALSGSPRGGPNVDESTLPPADRSQDGIGVLDLASGELRGKLASGNDPESVDLSADGRVLAVANEDSARASLIDAASGALLARIPVGAEPEGVRFTPDGAYLYVTSEANDRVDVIDVAARRALPPIATGKRPRMVVFSPDGARAYVSCELSSRIDVIDARARRALTSVEIAGTPRPLPMGLALDDSDDRLYVTLGRAGDVAVIDTGALRELGRVHDVGARPWGIALAPDGKTAYTANGPSGDISVIDTRSLTVLSRIRVGQQPWGLATVRLRPEAAHPSLAER